MKKPYSIVIAAALAASGMTLIGCHNSDKNSNPDAAVGGMTGGGSTDTYGTSSNARYQSTGNIGVDSGAQTPARPLAPVPNDTTYGNNPPMPAQTPVAPAGGTGGAGSGTSTPANTGNNQGSSTTGGESGAGVRSEVRPPANTNTNRNTTASPGAVIGGTAGNGSTYRRGPTTNPSEAGRSETGRSETGRSETSGNTH
jgi:hypothetical protein